MYTSLLGLARPALIGSILAAAFSLTPVLGPIPAAAAHNQAQAICADPRGAAYCSQPDRLVCCANPLPVPHLEVTPASGRPGETIVVSGSMLTPEITSSSAVLFEWEGQDGTLADGDIGGVAPGPTVQVEWVVPAEPPQEGVLCLHRLGFQTACTTFTILPATTPTDQNPDNVPDSSS